MSAATVLPDRFRDAEHLEEVMTTPTPELVAELGQVEGDIIILGVGGKIGPTLAQLAKRAAPSRRVIGVARFSEAVCARGCRRTASNASRPICSIASRSTRCQRLQCHLHGRAKVRLLGRRGSHLGDERACAGARRRGLCRLSHRRLFDRLRLSLCRCAARRRDRGDADDAAARRLREFLRRARADVPVFLAHARHARPHHPSQLCDRYALRRAARRRHAREIRRWPSILRPGM